MPLPMIEEIQGAPSVVFNAVAIHGKRDVRRTRQRTSGLSDVSFVVHGGEPVGILGSQADGVAMLKDAAAGVLLLAEGQIFVRSQPVVMDAGSAFDLDETLEANIETLVMSLELNGSKIKKAVARILQSVGLADSATVLCADIDELDIERARLAAVLHANPSLLIMDEPPVRGKALLDPTGKQALERYLRTGGSFLVIGREPRVLRRICSRIIWLHDGKIIMDGPAPDVARKYDLLESYKGDKAKINQLYRRFARSYPGMRIVVQ